MSSAIPILDLSSLLTADHARSSKEEEELTLSRELVAHLSTVGFVYLADHGVDAAVIEAGRRAASDFFALDVAFKESHGFDSGTDRPYGYKGFETEKDDPDQKFFDAKESVMFDGHRPETNAWPTEALRTAVMPLTLDMGRLARKILRMIGLGLGLSDPDQIADAHSFHDVASKEDSRDSFTAIRFNHYPFVEESQLKEGQVPCSEHADWGSVTLLLQDPDVPGLEVQTVRNGAYILAEPIPDTIVVNIGLMLENWTNGRLRATRHRVVKRLDRPRLSVPFFLQPDHDVMVEPLRELVDERAGESSQYQKCSSYEFVVYMLGKTQK